MRYLITFAVVLAIIVFGVFIFKGRSPSNTPVAPRELKSLASTEAEMRLTIDGSPINGEQEHNSVQIIVSRDQASVTIFEGYLGTVLKTKSFANNETAYEAFLGALQSVRFSSVRRSINTNEVGSCPLGNRYIYEITNNGDDNMRTWSTSCGGQGTYGGTNASTTRRIFQNPIPNYTDFIQGIPGIQV